MLMMVIERFKGGSPNAVGQRFRERGRMLPDGVQYVDSWMANSGDSCFQIMEAESVAHLDPWLAAWEDLVDFEVIPIVPTRDFWR